MGSHHSKGGNWPGILTMAGRSKTGGQIDPFRPPNIATLSGNGDSVQETREHECVSILEPCEEVISGSNGKMCGPEKREKSWGGRWT